MYGDKRWLVVTLKIPSPDEACSEDVAESLRNLAAQIALHRGKFREGDRWPVWGDEDYRMGNATITSTEPDEDQ